MWAFSNKECLCAGGERSVPFALVHLTLSAISSAKAPSAAKLEAAVERLKKRLSSMPSAAY